MDNLLVNIAQDPSSTPLSSDIADFITKMVTDKLRVSHDEYALHIDSIQNTCASLVTEVQAQRDLIDRNTDSINKQMEAWDNKLTTLIQDSTHMNNTVTTMQQKLDDISSKKPLEAVDGFKDTINHLQSDRKAIYLKLKKQISELKHTTNTVFKQEEDESET